MGHDIIRRNKVKEISIESVLFFDEIIIARKKDNIVHIVLTDIRLVYVYVLI